MSLLKQVKASAGSGKTYQLTRRFLTLLENADEHERVFACTRNAPTGYAWPEIMAVTFTNKAASEMKERVVTNLKGAALGLDNDTPCTPETARRALTGILRRYHRLNIRTIDSLLALLLRLFALEFRIRPDFQMVFNEQEMFEAVFDHFAAECEHSQVQEKLLDRAVQTTIHTGRSNGFWVQDTIRNRLFELTKFLRNRPAQLETDQETLRDLFITVHADFKKQLASTCGHFSDTGLPIKKHLLTFLDKMRAVDIFDELPNDSALIQKESFVECVNKAGKDKVAAETEAHYQRLKAAWQGYRSDHTALTGAYTLAPVVEIAQTLMTDLDTRQRQQGVVLGSALAGYVNTLLGHGDTVSEAYCRLGCRLHHLLIDEFQDTSRDQWEAITPLSQECLAKGGSLYYVGDVKQAIYGWRGGDSDLFDAVMTQPDLAGLALEADSATLPNNWRSFKNVVEFNNEFFRQFELVDPATQLADTIFAKAPESFRADFARELMVNFKACTQALPPKSDGTGGYVRMTDLSDREGSLAERTMAELDTLMDELTARRAYKDIAILTRSHRHAAEACDLLVAKGIPVITEKSLLLGRHPVVRQLVGLLGFLDYPRDDLAFLTFVSGSECFLAESGLAEDALHDWLIQPKKRPLGVEFRDAYPALWQRLIEPFYNQSGLMTPYDIIQEAVRVFRILKRHPDAELYVRRFLEVAHLAEENGFGSLSGFLEYWQTNAEEEKVPLPENIDAVRIMTIYKSKGLEFPVVIVPYHNWKAGPDADYAIRQFGDKRILTAMRAGLGHAFHASLGRAVREQLNLLYVAWTRAREELYGFYERPSGAMPAARAMEQGIQFDDEWYEFGTPPAPGAPSTPQTPPKPMPLPSETDPAQLMAWLPRLRVHRHNRDEYFFNERMRGEVAHKAMEHLAFTGNDTADAHKALTLAMQDFPTLGGLDKATRTQLEADIRGMLDWVFGQDALRQWLARGLREPEVMTDTGEFKRFDLLVPGPDPVVVDFKTGQPSPHNTVQVQEYMDILKSMHPNGTPAGYLVYLDLREIHAVEATA